MVFMPFLVPSFSCQTKGLRCKNGTAGENACPCCGQPLHSATAAMKWQPWLNAVMLDASGHLDLGMPSLHIGAIALNCVQTVQRRTRRDVVVTARASQINGL